MKWARNQAGFTIVELLIVIVVIAILAAIILISFRGITDRAQNSRVTTLVKQATGAIEVYKVTNGHYPPAAASESAYSDGCLGTGYKDGACQTLRFDPSCGLHTDERPLSVEDPVFAQEISTILGHPLQAVQHPDITSIDAFGEGCKVYTVTRGPTYRAGAFITVDTQNQVRGIAAQSGVEHPGAYVITYFVKGDARSCGPGSPTPIPLPLTQGYVACEVKGGDIRLE